jgi:hypothetical protein
MRIIINTLPMVSDPAYHFKAIGSLTELQPPMSGTDASRSCFIGCRTEQSEDFWVASPWALSFQMYSEGGGRPLWPAGFSWHDGHHIPSCNVLTIPSIGDWERFSSEVRQRDRGLFRVDLASANGDVQAAAYPFRTQFKL